MNYFDDLSKFLIQLIAQFIEKLKVKGIPLFIIIFYKNMNQDKEIQNNNNKISLSRPSNVIATKILSNMPKNNINNLPKTNDNGVHIYSPLKIQSKGINDVLKNQNKVSPSSPKKNFHGFGLLIQKHEQNQPNVQQNSNSIQLKRQTNLNKITIQNTNMNESNNDFDLTFVNPIVEDEEEQNQEKSIKNYANNANNDNNDNNQNDEEMSETESIHEFGNNTYLSSFSYSDSFSGVTFPQFTNSDDESTVDQTKDNHQNNEELNNHQSDFHYLGNI